MQKCTKDYLDRESLRAADGVKYFQRYIEASFHHRSSECVPLEILSIHSSWKRSRRNGQLDWKILIALATLEGFLDGHVAQDPGWWQEEDLVWWCKRKKGKKGLSKGNDGFHKGTEKFSNLPARQRCRVGLSVPGTKHRQRKGSKRKRPSLVVQRRQEPILNPDFQLQKLPMKKDMARSRNQTIGLPVTGLMIPGLQMLGGSAQRLFLHGWWQLR